MGRGREKYVLREKQCLRDKIESMLCPIRMSQIIKYLIKHKVDPE